MKRPLRDFEWELFRPLLRPGSSILEFGNKKNRNGVYKEWYESQGYFHVSVDINGLDGAIPLDFREPMAPRLEALGLPTVYDLVTNSGTIEHVETNLEAAWRNCFELTAVGGHQVHITPAANRWQAHGLYHPKQEFFVALARLNNMKLLRLEEYRWTPGKVLIRCVLKKTIHRRRVRLPGRRPVRPDA